MDVFLLCYSFARYFGILYCIHEDIRYTIGLQCLIHYIVGLMWELWLVDCAESWGGINLHPLFNSSKELIQPSFRDGARPLYHGSYIWDHNTHIHCKGICNAYIISQPSQRTCNGQMCMGISQIHYIDISTSLFVCGCVLMIKVTSLCIVTGQGVCVYNLKIFLCFS